MPQIVCSMPMTSLLRLSTALGMRPPQGDDVGSRGAFSSGFKIGPSDLSASRTLALLVSGGPGKSQGGERAVQVAAGHGTPALPAGPITQHLAGAEPPGHGSKGATGPAYRRALQNDLRQLTADEMIAVQAHLEQNPFFERKLTGDQVRSLYAQGVRNFSGADLIGANLSGANLGGAKLIGADLRGADLSGADLIGADLIGAKLRGADLRGAKLSEADLSGEAKLIGADLIGADLSGAKLRGADLRGAKLSEADLSWEAKLSRADLSGAKLIGADLSGADLSGAKLTGAKLTGADLTGADLTGADLRRAIGLTSVSIRFAKTDGNTKLP